MYTFKISKRYGELFKIEVFFYSLVDGETQAWNIGANPILLRTDASARIVAKSICADCKSEKATSTLCLEGIPILVASRLTLEKLLQYWGEQNVTMGREAKIVDDMLVPSTEVDDQYMQEVLSEML